MFINDALQFTPTLTAAQFATVLNAAYIAEAEGLVTFDADLSDALSALPKGEEVS
jgi:hypothetical protein